MQNYYAIVLKKIQALKTYARCIEETIPYADKQISSQIHDVVFSLFYGCGSPIPEVLDGLSVFDFGYGKGRDAYLCSSLVSENVHVSGIDMADVSSS